jgi:hypothetical protein
MDIEEALNKLVAPPTNAENMGHFNLITMATHGLQELLRLVMGELDGTCTQFYKASFVRFTVGRSSGSARGEGERSSPYCVI